MILTRKAHGLHHKEPFEGNYCILNGWWNNILDRSNFFRYLEVGVYKLTGDIPNSWALDDELKEQWINWPMFKSSDDGGESNLRA